jgi:hypothetical protein
MNAAVWGFIAVVAVVGVMFELARADGESYG